jgi:hypothetical protein
MLIYKKEAKWLVSLFDYFDVAKSWLLNPVSFMIDTLSWKIFPVALYENLEDSMKDRAIQDASVELSVLESTLLLLNCKNIGTEEWHPSLSLNKKRRVSNKEELFTYKTLTISMPGCKRNSVHLNGSGQYHNKIHFCRGHFKSYTDENKLFGKFKGLWWWQPHVRGQNKDGVVMKDYKVCVAA